MTDRDSPVTEDELHAYVDGELPADRQEAVAAWLVEHPDDAPLIAAWRAQAEAIRARYGGVAQEPVPERLKLERLLQRSRAWMAYAAAAAIAAFVIGGTAGWMARGASAAAPDTVEIMANEALGAHRLYIREVRHPIEVRAAERHLLPWLSKRVGTMLRAPELANYDLKLLGGRLLPGPQGPAALFMYESSSGERYTLYCSRIKAVSIALRFTTADNFGAVQWIENEYGYVVSGPANKETLKSIARSVYDQMENRAPAPRRSSADQLMSRRGS